MEVTISIVCCESPLLLSEISCVFVGPGLDVWISIWSNLESQSTASGERLTVGADRPIQPGDSSYHGLPLKPAQASF